MDVDQTDPIWGRPAQVRTWDYGGLEVDQAWRAGGTFKVHASVTAAVRSLNLAAKAKLSTWILDRNLEGLQFPIVDRETLRLVQSQSRLSVGARHDRFFKYLQRRNIQPGELIDFGVGTNADIVLAFTESTTGDELRGLLNLLVEDGLLDPRSSPISGFGSYRPTSSAFRRLDDMRTAGPESLQAFVAMWFGDDLNATYASAIAPAIRDAGYRPFRVDQKEHVNRIDDEIVAGIRASRFVIADFTCPVFSLDDGAVIASPRGGVYFEAGLAHGLGLDVIWMCRDDCLAHLHFDTRQYAHILWSSEDHLYEALYNRIVAVVGPVPDAPGIWTSRAKPPSR